jgi:hypothetical protein
MVTSVAVMAIDGVMIDIPDTSENGTVFRARRRI